MIPRQKQKQQVSEVVSQLGWDAQAAVPGLRLNPYELTPPESSGHGIMFGEMCLKEETRVVVKPFFNLSRGEREMSIASKLGKVGLNVPRQIGIYRGKEAAYLVARRYEGLTTLAQVDWHQPIGDPVYLQKNVPHLTRASIGLAKFQAVNAVHHDYQDKNAAEGPNQEEVYIDLERAQFNSADVNPVSRAEDMYKLVGSVIRSGFYGGRTRSYKLGAINEYAVAPYLDAVVLPVDTDILHDAVISAVARGMNVPKITQAAEHYRTEIAPKNPRL